MSNETFCHILSNKKLFAIWFKNTFQTDFVVNIHFMCFQVQLSNETFCHISSNKNLFALWFKNTSNWLCGEFSFHVLSSPVAKWNLLPQITQQKPVCSLIQKYVPNWLFGESSFHLLSSCNIMSLSDAILISISEPVKCNSNINNGSSRLKDTIPISITISED